jgi:hydroxysqualene dehydroxylase
MKVAVIGAGWAGLAAAVELVKAGHEVTVLEASQHLGGRARALELTLPGGAHATLDNGQHILIGAYSETLRLMQEVGMDPAHHLLRLPLTLQFPDGDCLQLPDWKKPWIAGLDVAAGVLKARGWRMADKLSLLRAASQWKSARFQCTSTMSVAQLCQGVTAPVMQMLIEPLCVSALNTPASEASAQVFLRIMHDALFAPTTGDWGSSNLLLPRSDLGSLFPQAAARWLHAQGTRGTQGMHCAQVHTHMRVDSINLLQNKEQTIEISCRPTGQNASKNWLCDAVLLAAPHHEAVRLLSSHALAASWCRQAVALRDEAIATVYAYAPDARLPSPMMALKSSQNQPAQFVFDRGQLDGHGGVLAFVVSASQGDAQTLQAQVIAQGREQLQLHKLEPIKTIVDKRATFACIPGLQRPAMQIAPELAPRLLACGDYVQGPYPSTLEGAVRSGVAAACALAGIV